MAEQRNYSAGRIALELEGAFAGPLVDVSGGEPFAQVVADPRGTGQRPGKHVAGIAFEPITMRFGVGMSEALYAWVSDALDARSTPKSGALLLADFDGAIRTRLEFEHVVITEVAFASLDGSSRSVPWLITVTFQPESTRRVPGSGTMLRTTRTSKGVFTSNFRVQIPGLPTSYVSAVELPTATADVKHSGDDPRDPGSHASDAALSNLVLIVGARDEKAYFDAAEKFLVQGHSTNADELGGQVDLLAPNLRDTLFTLSFKQIGLVRVAPLRGESGGINVVRRVRVEFYCEVMGFAAAKSVQASANSTEGGRTSSAPPGVATATIDAIAQLSTAFLGLASAERRDPAMVALRLRGGANDAPLPLGAHQRADGVEIGRAWAQQQASLEELTAIGALESADWDAVGLPGGHSLLSRLVAEGVVPGDPDHPADLDRSPFVEGMVSGATDVLREVRPHL